MSWRGAALLLGGAMALSACDGLAGEDKGVADGSVADAGAEPAFAVEFRITLTNIAAQDALVTSGGEPAPVVIAPGAWALLRADAQLFAANQSPSPGLTALAEDGSNTVFHQEIGDAGGAIMRGTFGASASGSYEENPIAPGDSVSFDLAALPGQRLAFAAMFVQSNDVFVATPPAGIELFDASGAPLQASLSAQLSLWDAGSELNEEPGLGPNQAPRQPSPNTGPDEYGVVTEIDGTDAAGFSYPSPAAFLELVAAPR